MSEEPELVKYTTIVVMTVLFFLLFFWGLDIGIGQLIEMIK